MANSKTRTAMAAAMDKAGMKREVVLTDQPVRKPGLTLFLTRSSETKNYIVFELKPPERGMQTKPEAFGKVYVPISQARDMQSLVVYEEFSQGDAPRLVKQARGR